jgi:hypothetical protein
MAGTTRLELATSAVTAGLSIAGTSRISRLDGPLSATVGIIGPRWDDLGNGLGNEFQSNFFGNSKTQLGENT